MGVKWEERRTLHAYFFYILKLVKRKLVNRILLIYDLPIFAAFLEMRCGLLEITTGLGIFLYYSKNSKYFLKTIYLFKFLWYN